jgi:hypothetical protein
VHEAGRDDREFLQSRPAVGQREVQHGHLVVGAEQDVAGRQVGVDERRGQGGEVNARQLRDGPVDEAPLPRVEQVADLSGQRDQVGDGPRIEHGLRARAAAVNAHRLLDDARELGFVRRAAQIVEGLTGGEVHDEEPVPVVFMHVATCGVGVQPGVADTRLPDTGDDASGARGDPGRPADREDLDHHPHPLCPQVDVAVLVPRGEDRPVADVA